MWCKPTGELGTTSDIASELRQKSDEFTWVWRHQIKRGRIQNFFQLSTGNVQIRSNSILCKNRRRQRLATCGKMNACHRCPMTRENSLFWPYKRQNFHVPLEFENYSNAPCTPHCTWGQGRRHWGGWHAWFGNFSYFDHVNAQKVGLWLHSREIQNTPLWPSRKIPGDALKNERYEPGVNWKPIITCSHEKHHKFFNTRTIIRGSHMKRNTPELTAAPRDTS